MASPKKLTDEQLQDFVKYLNCSADPSVEAGRKAILSHIENVFGFALIPVQWISLEEAAEMYPRIAYNTIEFVSNRGSQGE